MKYARSLSLVTVLLACCAVCAAEDAKVTIKHAWPAGTYVMTQTSKSQGEQLIGSQPMKSTSSSTMEWQLVVGEPNDKGEKKIAAKIVKYQFKEEGDAPSAYDSEAPADSQDKDNVMIFGAMVGAPIEITLDSDDAVVEISGLDKIWKDLSDKATTDAQKGKLAQASLEYSDKTVEQSIRRIEALVPKKAVGVGDKWTAGVRSDLPLIGELKQRYDCELKGVEDSPAGKLVDVQVQAKYESAKPKPGKIQGQEITISKLDVTQNGNVKFELATGVAVSDAMTMVVKAEMETTDEKGQPLKIESSGTNEITTTIAPAGKADLAPSQSTKETPSTEKSPACPEDEKGKTPSPAGGTVVIPGAE